LLFSDTFIESGLDADLVALARKVLDQQRITRSEGNLLYRSFPPGILAYLADEVRRRKHGEVVYFVRNIHLEPTNICIHHCRFCSYSARVSGKAWDLTMEEMCQKIREAPPGVSEIHITGAVARDRGIDHYAGLLRDIRRLRPDIHIKAFSAIELDHIFDVSGLSDEEGLKILQSAGLDSIPGGGAEIFEPSVRERICPDKSSSERWLAIHRSAHQLGIPSNATMLYGHIETIEDRIDHLDRLRCLQDETNGFRAFIPLKFKNKRNELSDVPETTLLDDMKTFSISRIYLDNFPHLKAYWPMLGKDATRLSLSFGVDDIDGTISDSTRIYSMAGANDQHPVMAVEEMEEMAQVMGRKTVERKYEVRF